MKIGSLILKEEYGQRAFDNRLQRKTFGVEWEKERVSWRKLNNNTSRIFSTPNIILVMKSSSI
jgi:hypothetical protein